MDHYDTYLQRDVLIELSAKFLFLIVDLIWPWNAFNRILGIVPGVRPVVLKFQIGQMTIQQYRFQHIDMIWIGFIPARQLMFYRKIGSLYI